MSDMMRGHITCPRGCCRSKPGDIESARARDKREAEAQIAEDVATDD